MEHRRREWEESETLISMATIEISPGSDCRTLISAAAYDNVLERIGGRRIQVKSSVRSSELLVALYESPPYDLKVTPMDVARLSINLTGVPVYGQV